MSGFGVYGDSYLVSYRDPNLGRTNEIFEKTVDYVEQFDAGERDMTKYIIGTISEMDTPLTPAAEGTRSMSAWLTRTTEEDLQKIRDEVLDASPADIRALAGGIRNFWQKGASAPLETKTVLRRKRSCSTRRSVSSIPDVRNRKRYRYE